VTVPPIPIDCHPNKFDYLLFCVFRRRAAGRIGGGKAVGDSPFLGELAVTLRSWLGKPAPAFKLNEVLAAGGAVSFASIFISHAGHA